MRDTFPHVKTVEVAQACLCLHVQRAARVLARHFDEVFRPLDLTNGQFSLLMALNRPQAPTVGELASFLAMDRTTLTALIKPLERRGLLAVIVDEQDRRKRRVRLTTAGHALLKQAYPLWCDAHAALERQFGDAPALRALLGRVTSPIRPNRETPKGPSAP
ncbi:MULTISPECIES: MarR family winged helix-turn-helix transcriptional regulator [Methylococcus]|uniref:MarR family transcriptional regulator n=1 Tax=Methylococcus capsulatus TaxID=414 RepID=A0ABZ2F7T1_METCP|nr:MarR family transcriptional regulator [Methylococcus capsulatus]MDF9392990.1 MarR family transcriptional regulator [Methylococcus capsulatus]